MQNTDHTMKSVINYFFQNRCLAQKVLIMTSTDLLQWNTSDPENYQVFLASLGSLSFFWCKNMECDQNQLWSKIGMNGRCAFTKQFLTTVTN